MLFRPVVPFALAGLSWTAAQALEPDLGATPLARYAAISAHPGLENAAALLFFVAGAFLVLAACAAVRVHIQGRGGRLIAVGQLLLGLGGLWLAAGRGMSDVIGWEVTDPHVPARTAAFLIDDGGGVAFTGLVLTLLALLLGPVLMAVGLRLAGRASWLPLVLWVVGVVTFMATEFAVKPVMIPSIAVACVGLGLIGRALGPSADRSADAPEAVVADARR